MREIKFRGILTETGEWIYGSLERRENVDRIGGYVITPQTMQDPQGDTVWIYDEVKPETVGQFIELQDKNGKEIYEGDIIKCIWLAELGITELDCEAIGQVVYQPAIAAYVVEFSNPFTWKSGEMFYEEEQMQLRDDSIEEAISFEVIGNIHENTELLK